MKRTRNKTISGPEIQAEILTALEGHTACSSELAHHLGRHWGLIWEHLHRLKDRGLIWLDPLYGRWEITEKARILRAVVALAKPPAVAIGVGAK